MKNSKVFLIVFAVMLSLNNFTYPKPKFILSFYGGFSAPLPQFSGQLGTSQVVAYQDNFYLQTSLNSGGEFKYAFGKNGNTRVIK